jgi:hypothetical protein
MTPEPEYVEALIDGEHTVLTYAYMRRAALMFLDGARNSEEGRLYRLIATIVFSAFMVEAHINHIGQKKVLDWIKLERKLTQRQRIDRILRELNLDSFDGFPQYQHVSDAFTFRDKMAHGKTERNIFDSAVQTVDWNNPGNIELKASWENLCTVDRAAELFAGCERFLEIIHEAAGLSRHEFRSLGNAAYSVKKRDV